MLLSFDLETKKGLTKNYYLQCDFCNNKSRSSTELSNVFLKARQDNWATRYGTGRTVRSSEDIEILDAGKNGPAKWCCPSCQKKDQLLSTEEKVQRKILGLSQDELDRICQP